MASIGPESAPLQRLRSLARQLASDFGSSRASRQSVATLCSLLPSLKYYSISVLSTQRAVIMSSVRAQSGPITLSLHTAAGSATGITAQGKGMRASLLGASSTLLTSLSDVQTLLHDSPSCRSILCLPIVGGGIRGALLLGFSSSSPDISPRRLAGLSCLCKLLSEALVGTAEEVICMVEQMIGCHQGCRFCIHDPSSSSEEDEEDPRNDNGGGDPCHHQRPQGRDGDSQASMPSMPPIPECVVEFERQVLVAIRRQGPDETAKLDSSKLTPCQMYAVGDTCCTIRDSQPAITTTPPPVHSQTRFAFSKPAMVSYHDTEAHGVLHPLWLTFPTSIIEDEFRRWYQARMVPLDALFAAIVVVSLALLWTKDLMEMSWPSVRAMALWALPPLALGWMASVRPKAYRNNRELALAVLRMYSAVVAAILIDPARVTEWMMWRGLSLPPAVTWWLAQGSFALLAPPLGLHLRQRVHVPLQLFLVTVLLVRTVPHSCGGLVSWTPCASGMVAIALAMGYVLPVMVARTAEVRARAVFVEQLQAATELSGCY